MEKQLHFYFDFSSPYGYLASTKIEALAKKHGRELVWHPILLGAVFKITGQAPLTTYPLKGEYAQRDFDRSAREDNIPFKYPDPFPIGAVAASRAFYWAQNHKDYNTANTLSELVHSLFKAYYVESINIGEVDAVLNCAQQSGIDRAALEAGLTEQSTKDLLRDAVDTSIKNGIFGSPTMVVDNEVFWGSDRIDQLDRWLERGGW